MKNCNLMKRYLGEKNKAQDVANTGVAKNAEHDDFPKEDGTIMMIFGGTPARPPRRKHKRILQEIYHTELTVPSYLRWFKPSRTTRRITLTTFHSRGPTPSWWHRFSAPSRCTRCSWMKEAASTSSTCPPLDSMGIQRSQLHPSSTPFHGVVPEMEAVPLGQIDLSVTFGDDWNFRKETHTFEVAGFSGTYHAILGRPAYAKFMGSPTTPTSS
jgi:hypothetical protein